MIRSIAIAAAVVLLAAGCQHGELKREVPSSPEASYQALPR